MQRTKTDQTSLISSHARRYLFSRFLTYLMYLCFQGKYKQAKEAYEQFVQSEGIEDIHKATAHKQLGESEGLLI